ncbi:MAG: prepilin-type N-terminal cleavage/methylation domain-containing protein [Candidatus Omnitrophica bacterium]|nr:prepilin-type N-terminal cleavage/methylation domain-containing protein [Candidatus Omnitrophota bacterium]
MTNPKAFTLVELLIVAAIAGIIGLTIASTFAGGLNIYRRMAGRTEVKTDILLAMEKMERDVRNTFSFKGLNFIGSSKKMTFPAMIRKFSSAGIPEESLGSVSYYRDDRPAVRMLSREEKKFSEAIKEDDAGKGTVTNLAPIEDISFKYYTFDPESESYSWAETWDKTEEKEEEEEAAGGKSKKKEVSIKDIPENIPLGVKIEVTYKDDEGDVTLTRAVFIEPAVSLSRAKSKAAAEEAAATEEKSGE